MTTGVSTNYGGTYVPGVSGTSSTNGTPPTDETLFPQADPADIERDNQRKGLEAQLAGYQAQKQQLEAQLAQYTQQRDALVKREESLKQREENLKREIEQLENDRDTDEAKAQQIKNDYEKNNGKLLEMLKKMEDKISETTEKSAQAAQEQEKRIQNATTNAFKMLESGEITEDQVPQYIAQQMGNENLVEQIVSSGVGVIEAISTQIKGIIAEMSQALTNLSTQKLKITSTSDKIKSKKTELTTVQEEKIVVAAEIKDVNASIKSVNKEIAAVDVNISNTQSELDALGAAEGEPPAVTPPPVTQPDNPFGDDNSDTPETQGIQTTGADNNPFVSVTTCVDFGGLKSSLESYMQQNNRIVQSMREIFNNQKEQFEEKSKNAA